MAQRRRRRGEAAAIVTELLVDAVTHTEELAVEDEAAIESSVTGSSGASTMRSRARGGRAPPDRGAVRPPGGALRGGGRPRAPGLPAGPVRRGGVEAPRALSRAARRGRRARWRCARRSGGRGGRRGQHLRGDGPRRRAGRRGRAVRRRPALRARAIDRAAGIPGLLVDVQRYWSGARRFRIGPHAQPNFAWVLLDRALLHYDSVARRTHARDSRCRARRARRHRGGVRARRAACPRDALSPAQARPARSSALGPRRARASDRPHPSPCRSRPGGGADARKPPSRAGRRLHADGLHGGDAAIDLSSMEGSILHRAFTAAEEAPLSRTPRAQARARREGGRRPRGVRGWRGDRSRAPRPRARARAARRGGARRGARHERYGARGPAPLAGRAAPEPRRVSGPRTALVVNACAPGRGVVRAGARRARRARRGGDRRARRGAGGAAAARPRRARPRRGARRRRWRR